MATIQKRGKSYLISVSAGYDCSGKQIRRTMTWKPDLDMTDKAIRDELNRQAVLFEEKIRNNHAANGHIHFKDFADRWFDDYAKAQLRPKTLERYEQFKERTYAAIGHIHLDKLSPIHLNAFYAQLAEPGQNQRTGGGLAPKTIRHYHTFVSSVMDRAVKWGLVQDNPCRRVDAPKVPKKELTYLDDKAAYVFMAYMSHEDVEFRTIFTLLLVTGMRRGELMGLEWKDIDWQDRKLHIRRTSQYTVERGIYTDDTKTEQSKRTIVLPPDVLNLLKEYRACQSEKRLKLGDRWEDHDRLFTQWDGKPMFPNAPYQMLQRFLDRHLCLPRINIHSLRHTNATLMIGTGTDIRTVSGLLGHSQTSTTLNIYAHQLQSASAAATESVVNILMRKNQA